MQHLTRLLLLVLVVMLSGVPSSLLAVEQVRNGTPMGFLASGPTNTVATVALSSAAAAGGWGTGFSQTGLAYGFVPTLSKQISKVKIYCSAVTGTLGATDLVADLYSDNAGVGPSTSIESRTSVTATPTVAAWVEFTGFTATSTLTAGTQYWLVFRNANATPTSNSPTYRHTGQNTFPATNAGSSLTWGSHKYHTTDGGVTWGTGVLSVGGWRIEFSDGTFMGVPIQNVAATTADYVYGNREVGVMFTSPANATINIIGISMPMARVGSTQGSLRFRLYSGNSANPTLLATTTAIPRLNLTTGSLLTLAYFATAQTISPGTVLRVVASNSTANGDTSNAYFTQTYTIDNTAASKALLSIGGVGFQKTLTTDSTATPVAFTETDTSTFSFGVLLDTNGEYTNTAAPVGGIIGG